MSDIRLVAFCACERLDKGLMKPLVSVLWEIRCKIHAEIWIEFIVFE